MSELSPFLVFAAFMALFAIRARREGVSTREWIESQNRETFSRPGWWKWPAIVTVAFCCFAVATGIAQAGFQWWYLLIPVAVGAIFGWWVYSVSRWARRP